MSDQLTHFICLGNNFAWGRAKTERGAVGNMRRASGTRATEYVVYHVTENAYVDELGDIRRPKGDAAPVLTKKV